MSQDRIFPVETAAFESCILVLVRGHWAEGTGQHDGCTYRLKAQEVKVFLQHQEMVNIKEEPEVRGYHVVSDPIRQRYGEIEWVEEGFWVRKPRCKSQAL